MLHKQVRNIIVKKAGKKGKGVFALRDFKKGDFILKYKKGELIHLSDILKLSQEEQKHLNEIDRNTVEIMRSPERYINHSCDPNAIMKWRAVYALKSIKQEEEITTDYRANGIFKNKWKCYCGSKNCKGYVISDFFTLPPEKQKLYLYYTLKVIREEYKRRHQKI